MSNSAANVSAGKPKVTGAIFSAPAGSTLPTTAVADLDNAFVSLGYVSEDGVTHTKDITSGQVRAWGGDVVLNYEEGETETYQLTLIESMNTAVLKEVYGQDNVIGTALTSGITVKAKPGAREARAWVIDEIMKGNVLRRTVIPRGTITAIGEIVHRDNDAIGYQITISTEADDAGFQHYEYMQTA